MGQTEKQLFQACLNLSPSGRRVMVDVERGRTVEGWLPRRLGGGRGPGRQGRNFGFRPETVLVCQRPLRQAFQEEAEDQSGVKDKLEEPLEATVFAGGSRKPLRS